MINFFYRFSNHKTMIHSHVCINKFILSILSIVAGDDHLFDCIPNVNIIQETCLHHPKPVLKQEFSTTGKKEAFCPSLTIVALSKAHLEATKKRRPTLQFRSRFLVLTTSLSIKRWLWTSQRDRNIHQWKLFDVVSTLWFSLVLALFARSRVLVYSHGKLTCLPVL